MFSFLRCTLFPRPRIFISYAREDADVASWLLEVLEKRSFAVYMDTRGTLAGEQFLAVIVDHLRKSDAILALVSEHSAVSEWCQAELYYAHALSRAIIPIRLNSAHAIEVPAPLDLLQQQTQYVVIDSAGDRDAVAQSVHRRFQAVKRRAHFRWLRRCAIIALTLGLFGWGFQSGFANLLRESDRRFLVSRLSHTQAILDDASLRQEAAKFSGDETLRARLLAIAEDTEQPVHTRLNACIIASDIGGNSKRWYVEHLTWGKSTFRRSHLTNMTFRTGAINSVRFDDVSFNDVVWNSGPDVNVGGTTFSQCRFNGGEFANTNVIDSEFVNCFFDGTVLDVTGFGAVRFKSVSENPNSEVITGGELCSFQNVVIANCREPAAPGVMDFSGPKNEVMFTNVVFESCRFRGFIRPSWFERCSFSHCSFPAAMALTELSSKENFVTDCFQRDESCR